MTGAGIVVEDLTVLYRLEEERTRALDAVSLTIDGGEVTAVLGPSGSGKSTLMAVLGGLQRATSGSVRIGGTEITALPARALLALRRERVAVVVQDPRRNLIPHGSAVDNVRFAQGAGRRPGRLDPRALLADLGLGPIADAPVDRMSGGERQRVAIATGLAIAPEVLLVDEPTSALDERTRDDVLAMLLAANRRTGTTVVLITHDEHVADRADHRIRLQDGRVAP